eukprot:scaffold318_cov396-Prasinococcus_capsulatus_cf.AAC.13
MLLIALLVSAQGWQYGQIGPPAAVLPKSRLRHNGHNEGLLVEPHFTLSLSFAGIIKRIRKAQLEKLFAYGGVVRHQDQVIGDVDKHFILRDWPDGDNSSQPRARRGSAIRSNLVSPALWHRRHLKVRVHRGVLVLEPTKERLELVLLPCLRHLVPHLLQATSSTLSPAASLEPPTPGRRAPRRPPHRGRVVCRSIRCPNVLLYWRRASAAATLTAETRTSDAAQPSGNTHPWTPPR